MAGRRWCRRSAGWWKWSATARPAGMFHPATPPPWPTKLREIILRPEAWRGFVAAGRARYEAIFSEPVAAAAIAAIAADKLQGDHGEAGQGACRPPSGDTAVKFAFPSHLVRPPRADDRRRGDAERLPLRPQPHAAAHAVGARVRPLRHRHGDGRRRPVLYQLAHRRSRQRSGWAKSTNSAGVDAHDVTFGTAALIVALLMAVGTAIVMHLLGDPSGIAAGCFVGAWSLRSHMRTAFFARRPAGARLHQRRRFYDRGHRLDRADDLVDRRWAAGHVLRTCRGKRGSAFSSWFGWPAARFASASACRRGDAMPGSGACCVGRRSARPPPTSRVNAWRCWSPALPGLPPSHRWRRF